MKRFAAFVLVFAVCVLAACVKAPVSTLPTQTETTAPVTMDVLATTSTDIAIPSETQVPPGTRTNYELTAVLDYPSARLNVDESVTYMNRSTSPINDLVFVVEPNLRAGVFTLNSLTWEDGAQVEDESLTGQKLTIPLREGLAPGSSVQLKITYSLDLPDVEGVLCMTDIQANFSGWYPYAAPYIDGRGWVVHDPAHVGESQLYELADFTVNIRIDGAPAEFMLAASARGIYDQGWYRFSQQDVRNFTWSGSNYYQMLEAYAGDIRVRAFVFPADIAGGQASLDATVQALELYAELYGPYTHDNLTIVESGFADGMEYDGLYYLGQEYFNTYKGSPDGYLTAISVHETAHDWWYGMVTNDQAYEPWLDESFSTYSELLYYEHYYPELVDWWWQTRVNSFEPQGWVNGSIYDHNSFRPYVNAVYLRGAQFLDEVRGLVGDETFAAFMREFFTQMHARSEADHLGLVTADDFWQVLGGMTDVDLSSVKAEYFLQP
jgi:hypothetical protein